MDNLITCAVVSALRAYSNFLQFKGRLSDMSTKAFVCTWRFLLSCFTGGERQKPWRHVIFDAAFRWVVDNLPIPRTAYILGLTEDIYTTWARQRGLPMHGEDIGENAKIFWILNGEWNGSVPQRVIHGGGSLCLYRKMQPPSGGMFRVNSRDNMV